MDNQESLRIWRTLPSVRPQPDTDEFAEARYACNSRSGESFRNLRWIVHKVRLAETHLDNRAPRQRQTQSAHNCFDFGKFRHRGVSIKIAQLTGNNWKPK